MIKVILINIILLASFMGIRAQDTLIEFGIYETVPLNNLRPFSENLSRYILNQSLKMDSPVLGYTNTNNKSIIDSIFKEEATPELNLMMTRIRPSSRESYAIIALRKDPAIVISDITGTVPKEEAVVIKLTHKGSRKWSKMTKQNAGQMVAFVINDEIWSLPMINARIKSGLALIEGIESREKAVELSEMINSSLQDSQNRYP